MSNNNSSFRDSNGISIRRVSRLPLVQVLVNNNNLFPCLEIIGVFNFRTDARIRKFFDAKISYPKIFGHENFRIYGIIYDSTNVD